MEANNDELLRKLAHLKKQLEASNQENVVLKEEFRVKTEDLGRQLEAKQAEMDSVCALLEAKEEHLNKLIEAMRIEENNVKRDSYLQTEKIALSPIKTVKFKDSLVHKKTQSLFGLETEKKAIYQTAKFDHISLLDDGVKRDLSGFIVDKIRQSKESNDSRLMSYDTEKDEELDFLNDRIALEVNEILEGRREFMRLTMSVDSFSFEIVGKLRKKIAIQLEESIEKWLEMANKRTSG